MVVSILFRIFVITKQKGFTTNLKEYLMPTYINSLKDLKEAESNPYCYGSYLTDGTSIFAIDADDNMNQGLIETYEPNELIYEINWEDDSLYADDGTKIESVY